MTVRAAGPGWAGLGALAATALLTAGCAGQAATARSATPASAYMASATAAFHFPSGVLAAADVPSGRTAALCGSLLQPCPAGEMGKAAAQEPTAGTVRGFTEVDLTQFFESPAGAEGTAVQGGPPPRHAPTGWSAAGINGTPYPEQFFPSTGNFGVTIHGLSATFLIPAEGAGIRSTFDLAQPADIPVPAGRYRAAWILGQGIGGGAGEIALQAVYADGTKTSAGFDLTGWCHPQSLAPGEFPAVVDPNLLSDTGGRMEPAFAGCGGLYAAVVPLDASRALSSLDVLGATSSLLAGTPGGAAKDFIVAVSLQQ